MTAEQIVFWIIATITVVAALGMVSVGTVFHAALLMVLTFIGIAALYMLMGAGFMGIIQVLIYVGAIAVLMIFAIMLTPEVMRTEGPSRFTAQWPIAAVLASGLLVVLVPPLLSTPWPVKNEVLDETRNYAVELGMAFMSPEASGYLLPFWLAAAFLLVALVGAIVIAREDI